MIKLESDDKSEQSAVYPVTIFNLIRPKVIPQVLNPKVHISELHHFYNIPLHLATLKWYSNLTFKQHGFLRWGSSHNHFQLVVHNFLQI